MRYTIDFAVPDFVEPDQRYGYRPHHEESLLETTRQGSSSSSFKEVLIEFLTHYFQDNPKADYWENTVSMLMRGVLSTSCNDLILKNMKMEQASRYLEQIQREGSFRITTSTAKHSTRLWRFYRDDTAR
jgi:hypothetical protein